jgi:hypothetical protein
MCVFDGVRDSPFAAVSSAQQLTAVNADRADRWQVGHRGLLCRTIRHFKGDRAMLLLGIARFERFFRLAAGLDIDKFDLKRYSNFVNDKIYDLLLRARAAAKANGRDIIEPYGLPVTKGLQECIHTRPSGGATPAHLAYSEETEGLPQIAGGLSVALARSFKVIDPELKNPRTEHWERVLRIFGLLL